MNYLFHIHSNINLLTATLIVENMELDKSKVLYILSRGISTNFGVDTVELPEKVYYHQFNTLKSIPSLKFFANKKVLSIIDDIVDKCVNQSFTYFCPNSRVPLYRAFISNPKCVAVNYVEDGMDAYLSRTELLKKFKIPLPKHLKWADIVFRTLPFFYGKRLNYIQDAFMPNLKGKKSMIYCLTEASFKNQENNNRVVLNPKEDGYFSKVNLISADIFVFDAVKNQKVVPEKILYDFVSWFCKQYFKEKKIAIKFHPFQDSKEIEIILKIFEDNGVTTEIIPQDLVLEAVFLNNKEINVFGIGSSLLVYATLYGVKNVHVLYPFFEYMADYISPRLSTWNDVFLKRDEIYVLKKTSIN